MTNHFKNMLYLFSANARGTKVQLDGELNIEEIRRLAIEQGIWTLVYPELAKLCDAKKYQMSFFSMVSKGIAKKEFNLGVIKKLEELGVECCLLKGAAISHLYKDSECRVSGDTDILIKPSDEEKTKKLLLGMGYQLKERAANDHHLSAIHPVGGLLEAHVMLYSKTTQTVVFNGKNLYSEPWAKININGYDYNILGINDGLMYLTAHYIKHLVNEGGGVRQMMDLLLYMEKYKEEIDFEKYNGTLKELNYDGLVDVIKTIGAKYFGFDYEIVNEELADKLLSDSEEGGIFGFETDVRKNFYDAYCDRRTTMSKYQHKIYMSLNGERSIWNRIFLSSVELVNIWGIGYAKNKFLVPVAWVHRFFLKLCHKKETNQNQETQEFKDRMSLMQDLGMI